MSIFAPPGSGHIMTTSAAGVEFLHGEEACRLTAYQDTGHVWTLGWGTTRYPGGRKVAQGDTCTRDQADAWFRYDLTRFERDLDALTNDGLSQRQWDALMSLTYNIGDAAFEGSTVRKRINLTPNDEAPIRESWMRWHFDNTDADPALEPVPGLWKRRHAECDFYFGATTPLPPMPRAA